MNSGISSLSGTFTDSALEIRFRKARLDSHIRDMTPTVLVPVGVVLMFAISDLLNWNSRGLFSDVMLYRIAYVAFALTCLFIIRKIKDILVFDLLVMLWALATQIFSVSISISRPPNYYHYLVMNILIPVFVYTFLPYRLSWKVPSVLLMTFFEMWVLFVYKEPMPSGALFATIAAYSTVNILGYLVARRFAISEREHFLQYLNEAEAKEKYSAIVSRQEQLVSELEKAYAVKTRLFSIIGHDLHDTFNDLLALRQNTSTEALEEFEQRIQSSREQIRNLLTWVKIQNNSLPYAPSAFDLKELLEEVMHRYAAEAARKNVSLTLTHDPIRTIVADREMLDQVFENLITNAFKYTPENGRIEVEIKREGLHLAVVVRNDGATLPDDLLQAFTDGSIPEGSSGLSGSRGLGLLLCRELVARNRGQFGIHTLPEGGTRAEVWLPQG